MEPKKENEMKRTLLVALILLVAFGSAFAAPKSKVKIALIVESTVDDTGW